MSGRRITAREQRTGVGIERGRVVVQVFEQRLGGGRELDLRIVFAHPRQVLVELLESAAFQAAKRVGRARAKHRVSHADERVDARPLGGFPVAGEPLIHLLGRLEESVHGDAELRQTHARQASRWAVARSCSLHQNSWPPGTGAVPGR